MESRPPDLTDVVLGESLRDGWGVTVRDLAYVPLGFGSHHWALETTAGERHFVTVDDLDGAPTTRTAAFDTLTRAIGTASTLHARGLEFVVAPLTSRGGVPVRHLGERYAIALYPHIDGRAGNFADVMEPEARAALLDVLAVLHGTTLPDVPHVPRLGFDPIHRASRQIRDGLDRAGDPWTAGPYGERVRQWLLDHETEVRALIARTDRRMAESGAAPDDLVITHGEPHPGNVIETDAGIRLIDWDTVGLALPERDLWFLGDDPAALTRYTQRTGRTVNDEALALYRDAWTLSDLAAYLHVFRAEHYETEDSRHGWQELQRNVWTS